MIMQTPGFRDFPDDVTGVPPSTPTQYSAGYATGVTQSYSPTTDGSTSEGVPAPPPIGSTTTVLAMPPPPSTGVVQNGVTLDPTEVAAIQSSVNDAVNKMQMREMALAKMAMANQAANNLMMTGDEFDDGSGCGCGGPPPTMSPLVWLVGGVVAIAAVGLLFGKKS